MEASGITMAAVYLIDSLKSMRCDSDCQTVLIQVMHFKIGIAYSFTQNLVQLDSWFDPRFGGVNKDARMMNSAIQEALADTDIQLFNLTYMSEFRADAHPAIWLGKKDAVAIYGQDCMHWCLPGVTDTWVDILAAQILHYFLQGKG